ncbi:MAG: IS5 family transposase, partial [bacterium]
MPHHYPKRSQYKYTKKAYRVRNWKVYETALRKRGELTLWFSEEAAQAWYAPANSAPGGQRIYSDLAIQTALTVRSVYRLGLRQTEGFLRSVSALLGLNIRIPDHSTLSRRSKHLGSIRASMSAHCGPVHILVDSAGLRVHSRSEPREEQNRRRWRKLHLAIDAKTGELLASELSAHRASDCSQIPGLLKQIPGALASLTADSAYDSRQVCSAIEGRRPKFPAKIVIPPRRNARLRVNSPILASPRDHTVRSIRELGIRRWGKQSGYMRRSLAETQLRHFVQNRTSNSHLGP